MDTTLLFSQLSLWQLFILTIAVSALALEAGYQLGRRRRKRPGFEKDAPVSASVGATLGLLAFMLAMTFGVAMSQFDVRRQAFLDNDNLDSALRRCMYRPRGDGVSHSHHRLRQVARICGARYILRLSLMAHS